MLDVDVRGLEEAGEVGAYEVAKAVAARARELGVLLGWSEGVRGRVGRAGAAFSRALSAALSGAKGWDEAVAAEAERLGATAALQIYDSFSIHLILLRGAEPEWGGPCPRCGKPLLCLRVGGELVPAVCPSCGRGALPGE